MCGEKAISHTEEMRLKDINGPKKIIFAIPLDKNYEAFKKIFEK